jgi:hypothetical protein
MPLTPDAKRNERLKHLASWFNTLVAGVITAGTFVPAAQFIFNILPAGTDNGLVVGMGGSLRWGRLRSTFAEHLFLGVLR